MDRMHCPGCGRPILSNLAFCPHCGQRQGVRSSSDDRSRNPFDILQISRDAEEEVIEAAYRSLAKKYHPDSIGASPDAERMKEINWAYAMLKDPARRNQRQSRSHRSDERTEKRSYSERKGKPESSAGPAQRPQDSARDSGRQPDRNKRRAEAKRQGIGYGHILVGLIVVFLVASLISAVGGSEPAHQTSNTRPPIPTATSKISSSSPTNCIEWDRPSKGSVGKEVCVFGRIAYFHSTNDYVQVIRFSTHAGDFTLRGRDYYFDEIERGQCVVAIGILSAMDNELYISIDSPSTRLGRSSECH